MSSEIPGAGGFLIPEGKPVMPKLTKAGSHYRPAELMSIQRCATCVMFTADRGGGGLGKCDLGWRAQSSYVCDYWEAKS